MGNCIRRPMQPSARHNHQDQERAVDVPQPSETCQIISTIHDINRPVENENNISEVAHTNGHAHVITLDLNMDVNGHHRHSSGSVAYKCRHRTPSGNSIDELVADTLRSIRTLVEIDQEPPRSMLLLHKIAEKESGWVAVVLSLIRVVPVTDPLGPAVIILLLDECPLPTKGSLTKLTQELHSDMKVRLNPGVEEAQRQQNICTVLGCLAEKMAGPNSTTLLTENVLEYFIGNLHKSSCPSVILFSLIALEKFALTSENKLLIDRRLHSQCHPKSSKKKKMSNPLERLERWIGQENLIKRQVGFCSQWCLDNLFIIPNRKFTYETLDMTKINVMLNAKDVSEYLKISPNGLEARCDAASFESVRCTFQVDEGVWYYEVLIFTSGVMQIGWATKNSKFLNYEGHGIGDDEYSVAYDGCRQLIWYNAVNTKHRHTCWKPGDVLGVLMDLEKNEVIFSLNGDALEPHRMLFNNAKSGFFAAASFMSFQHCEFNFGAKPFQYAPARPDLQTFNSHGCLSDAEKHILPRHKLLERLQSNQPQEGACELCFDRRANILLRPCLHSGFCVDCALQLEDCPLCRTPIVERLTNIG